MEKWVHIMVRREAQQSVCSQSAASCGGGSVVVWAVGQPVVLEIFVKTDGLTNTERTT